MSILNASASGGRAWRQRAAEGNESRRTRKAAAAVHLGDLTLSHEGIDSGVDLEKRAKCGLLVVFGTVC